MAGGIGHQDLSKSILTLRWHDFRHEAISRCFDAGRTIDQVMDFSGHVDVKSLLRYRHPKVDQAVARLRFIEASRPSRVLPAPVANGHVEGDRVLVDA